MGDEIRTIGKEVAQAERDLAAAHQVGHFRTRRGAQLEPHAAGPAAEAAERVDDVRVGQRADQGERQAARQARLQVAHGLLAVLQRGQGGFGVRTEGAARLGEPRPPAQAIEQRCA